MNSKLSVLCVTCVAAGAIGAAAWSADVPAWPGWQGLRRDAKSPDTGLLKEWPKEGPRLAWKTNNIGIGFSGVCVAEGKVFITGCKDKTLHLACFSIEGARAWDVVVGPEWTQNYPGSRSTPTYAAGNLFIETGLGKVVCLSAKDGGKVWERSFSEFGASPHSWGYAESPLVAGGKVFVTPGGDACMAALDQKTGRTVWQSQKFGKANYCSPIPVVMDGVPFVVNGGGAGLIAVHAGTGKILWTNDFAANNTANCCTPAFADGYLFWSCGYGKGGICLKLTKTETGIHAAEAWKTGELVCHHGGYVIHEGHIYGNHADGWSCLELKTGTKKWGGRGPGKGSLCFADGMLYLFGEKGGKVMLAAADPSGFKESGSFIVQGKGPSWAHPVVIGGLLYLRYDDNLYCYNVRK